MDIRFERRKQVKDFFRNYLRGLILSSIAILLPMIFGLIAWNKIPDLVPVHFNPSGSADGFGSKAMLVFLMPLIMLATQWLLFFISSFDKKSKEQSKKVYRMVLWIIPIVTFYVCGLMYSIVFGAKVNFSLLTGTFMGILLIIIGNYLPKCKMNSVVGIRTVSTFSSEENWNKTHRLAGKFGVFGGIVLILASALCLSLPPEVALLAVLVPILLVSTVSPAIYSHILFKKQLKNKEISLSNIPKNLKYDKKKVAVISAIISAVTFVLCSVLLFSGDIRFELNDTGMSVVADLYEDISIEYHEIDAIELRENADRGSRVFGFGSPKLLMGSFRNDEFGDYTRYSYTKCENEIAIFSNGRVLVISGETEDKTTEIYNTLVEKCN